MGLAFVPLTVRIFSGFRDKGYIFSKILAVLVTSYAVYLMNSLQILAFSRIPILVVSISLSIAAFVFAFKQTKPLISREIIKYFAYEEIVFFSAFLFWAVVRSMEPSINGLEKPMDFGLLNSILRSDYMPPQNVWLSGTDLNYYYFGHFITAVLTCLTGIPAAFSYNLMAATLFALSFSSAVSIGGNLIGGTGVWGQKPKVFFITGGISALLLCLGGNFHFVYKYIQHVLNNGLQATPFKYWYAHATRFIGHDPPTADRLIHEFPAYSFVVSDLHAHVLNLPACLFFMALLFSTVQKKNNQSEPFLTAGRLSLRRVTGLGFLLGLFYMTNSWDVLSYGLLFFSVCLMSIVEEPVTVSQTIKKTWNAITHGIALLFIAAIFALPFIGHFKPFARNIEWTTAGSPLWQLFIVYGGIWSIILIFLARYLIKNKSAVVCPDVYERFILASAFTVLLLNLIPEIVIVTDNLPETHKRANTAFKLGYASYVMGAVISGPMISITIWRCLKSRIVYGISIAVVIILSSLMVFPFYALPQYYSYGRYQGLDGLGYLKPWPPGSFEGIQWLNNHVKGDQILLEAPGESYAVYHNLASSSTGMPSVLGWKGHISLWENDEALITEREEDIRLIYSSHDPKIVQQLLRKHRVQYIIVSSTEHKKYGVVAENQFDKIGQMVFKKGEMAIYQVTQNSL